MSDLVVVYQLATGQAVSVGSVVPQQVAVGLAVLTYASPTWEEYRAGLWRWDVATLQPVALPPPRDITGELLTALAADPPVLDEVLRLTGDSSSAAPSEPVDYSPRRATLQAGLDQLRGLARTARTQLAALPAPGSRTAAQREQAYLRRYLLALTRVVILAVLRPVPGDDDGVPE